MGIRLSRSVIVTARVLLGFGLLAYVLTRAGGAAGIQRLLASAWLMGGFAVQAMLGAGVEAKRLGLLLRSQQMRLSFGNGYRLVLIGAFFGFAIPGGTGGDVMKLYYLASENRSRAVEVTAVLLVDRAVGLFSLLGVAILLVLVQPSLLAAAPPIRWLVGLAIAGMLSVAVAALVSWSDGVRATAAFRYVTSRAPLHRYWRRASDALYAFRDHKDALASAVALSALGQLLLAGMYLTAGRVLVPAAPALLVASLALLGLVANALPITPGGLGVGEAAFQALFRLAGFEGGAQLVLAWRAGLVPLALAGCFLYVTGVKRHGRRLTHASPSESTEEVGRP